MLEPLPRVLVADIVRAALAEDRAAEDITTRATVTETLRGRAAFIARTPGVAAGFPLAAEAFHQRDPAVAIEQVVAEGAAFPAGAVLCVVTGPVRALLTAERTALNFVQRLSGVATLTAAFVLAVAGTNARILDTRKTTPGLRDLEKYAVRCGGGTNHRRDLAVMAMVKDNHRLALTREGLRLADGVAAIRQLAPGIPVEVEIDDIGELEDALAGAPDWILLDNMPPALLREAVVRCRGRARLEASGGVTLATVREIAMTGVDAISVGALTHSAPALDIALDLDF